MTKDNYSWLETLIRAAYNTGAVSALNDEYPSISVDDILWDTLDEINEDSHAE